MKQVSLRLSLTAANSFNRKITKYFSKNDRLGRSFAFFLLCRMMNLQKFTYALIN